MQHDPSHLIDRLVHVAATQLDGAATGGGFETAAENLGTALRHLCDKQRIQQAQHEPFQQAQKQQQQRSERLSTSRQPAAFNSSSSSSSSSVGELTRILTSCIRSSHPATAPVTAYMLSSSSGREALLSQPQPLADLVAAACAEQQGRSLAPLREAVAALVEQAGSRLGQIPELFTALQQQLECGSRGAGELLWGLTDTPAGRQLIVGQPGILAAAAKGVACVAEGEVWSPQTVRQPQAYAWAAALVALMTGDDASATAVAAHEELLQDLQRLLVLQLPGKRTMQYEQLQAWELWAEALGCGQLLQSWATQLGEGGAPLTCGMSESAALTTHAAAAKAAGEVFKVLLSGLPVSCLESELFTHQEVPALLLQLQRRLEALGDTSLLEGVGAMVQRLREEDLPTAAAAYPHWRGLYEAAAQLQPGAVGDTVASPSGAGSSSSMAALCAGVRLGQEPCLQRLAAMLTEGTAHSREQVLGCPELPGALAHGLTQTPEGIAWALERKLYTALLQLPLGQELLCSSQELQQVVATNLQQDGEAAEACIAMGTSPEERAKAWALVLTAFTAHPQLLVELLLHGMVPAVQKQAYPPDRNTIPTIAAAEGLEEAFLALEGGALDLLLVKGYTDHTARMVTIRLLRNHEEDRLPAIARLLLQWPIQRVVAALLGRLSSSNSKVVLGALLLLQHLQQVANQEVRQQGSTSAAATGRAVGDAVAAAVRGLAQPADMAHLVRDMQEAAVNLAQQHQVKRGGLRSAKRTTQQQQQTLLGGSSEEVPQQQAQLQLQQPRPQAQAQCEDAATPTGIAQQPGAPRSRKRRAGGAAVQQGDAVAQRSPDQQTKKVKGGAGAARGRPGAAGSSTPVPAGLEDHAKGAAAAAGQDGQQPEEVVPQYVAGPSGPSRQQQQQVYQLTVGDVHMAFELEPPSPV